MTQAERRHRLHRSPRLPGPFLPAAPGQDPSPAHRWTSDSDRKRVGFGAVYVASPHPAPLAEEGPDAGARGRARGASGSASALAPSARAGLAGELRRTVRVVQDFPRPGARFWDVTPLLQSPTLFRRVVTALAGEAEARGAEAVAGIDPRGILLAPAVALQLAVPFIPVAAPGTLPGNTASAERREERAIPLRLAVQKGRILPGQRVALLDDLLISGGTATTAARLLEEQGGIVAGIGVVVEVRTGYGPRDVGRYNIFSLLVL